MITVAFSVQIATTCISHECSQPEWNSLFGVTTMKSVAPMNNLRSEFKIDSRHHPSLTHNIQHEHHSQSNLILQVDVHAPNAYVADPAV